VGSLEGALTIAYAASWASEDEFLGWADALRTSGWPQAEQAYWEVIALYAGINAHAPKCTMAIDTLLASSGSQNCTGVDASAGIGVAYAAANLWTDYSTREFATSLFERLAPLADDEVARALFDLFRVAHEFQPDPFARRILESVFSHRLNWKSKHHTFLVERLLDVLPDHAELVSRVADELVKVFGKDLANLSTSRAAYTPSMISIALTLQRQTEPLRTRGLDLFEALLNLEAYQVRDVLAEIDRRPQTGAARSIARVRRKRMRRRAGVRT
jgi:hypothetical protein